jgi:nicotinate phosphoribosyltransferase
MATSKDCPALGGVYKVVEIKDGDSVRYPIKLSSSKRSWPGRKQVFRRKRDGIFTKDVIGLADETLEGDPLLAPVMKDGQRTAPSPSLDEIRARFLEQMARMPDEVKLIHDPAEFEVKRSEALVALADRAHAARKEDSE